MSESKPHTKLVPTVRVRICPPGDAEPRDPGWEADKPFERRGFRELDEYRDEHPDNRPGGVDRTERVR